MRRSSVFSYSGRFTFAVREEIRVVGDGPEVEIDGEVRAASGDVDEDGETEAAKAFIQKGPDLRRDSTVSRESIMRSMRLFSLA